MKQLRADIENNDFKPVYLLYGEEVFLRDTYRKRLSAAILGLPRDSDAQTISRSMNYRCIQGKLNGITEITQICETMPFMADRRILVLDQVEMNADNQDLLLKYLDRLPETAVIICVADEVDKRSRFYKYVSKNGYVCDFPYQDEAVLTKWMAGYLKKEGCGITRDAVSMLIEWAGPGMVNIISEMDKLIAYCMDRGGITADDVSAVCSRGVEDRIFKMLEAMVSGNRDRAMALYYDLLLIDDKTSNLYRILAMMEREYNLILKASGALDRGMKDNREIAKLIGASPYFTGRYLNAAKRIPRSYVVDALEACADLTYGSRNGEVDLRVGLDMLMVRFSSNI